MGVREALLRASIASAAQIDEALARQQLYGADIVTNLLELVELDEATVQRALGEAYGMSLAPSGELPYAAGAAIELVPRSVASDLNVYPYRVEDGLLTLVVSGPLTERSAIDLAFALKVQLRTLFTVAPRVKQAVARDYAFALDKRTHKALAKLERASRQMTSEAPPPLADVRSLSQFPRPRSIAPFGFPDNWSDAVTPDAAQLFAETSRQPEVRLTNRYDLKEAPETSRSIFDPHASQPEFTALGLNNEVPATVDVKRTPAPSAESSDGQRAVRPRRRGPYTVAAAKLDLKAARSGDEVLEVFFDYAGQYFDYSAVFALHGEEAEVRDSRGRGRDAPSLSRRLALREHPSLSQVSETKTWLLCDLHDVDPGLAGLLLRDTGQICLLLPVVVKERCVLLLYGGFDTEPVQLSAVGELLAFVPLVARALEQAILARKGLSQATAADFSGLKPKRARFGTPSPEERARALADSLSNNGGSGKS
jgi:hypothetical protein